MHGIKYLVMDVDGTMTDGKIYMGQDGEAIKAFDVKDGCGIVLVLPKYNIVPVIITARESKIVENRCKELGISELYQGVGDKLKTMKTLLQRNGDGLDTVAYIGDDIPDMKCMEAVKKAGGVVMCPANAISEIKILADYVSRYKAGEGAVRDSIDFLIAANIKVTIYQKVKKAIDEILKLNFDNKTEGVIDDGITYSVQVYETKDENECIIESHRYHVDVQYMIEGSEEFVIYKSDSLSNIGNYDTEKDADFWENGKESSRSVLVPGSLMVVYSGQPHKGAIIRGEKQLIRKVVCKVEI